jgi:hypothetical protein
MSLPSRRVGMGSILQVPIIEKGNMKFITDVKNPTNFCCLRFVLDFFCAGFKLEDVVLTSLLNELLPGLLLLNNPGLLLPEAPEDTLGPSGSSFHVVPKGQDSM